MVSQALKVGYFKLFEQERYCADDAFGFWALCSSTWSLWVLLGNLTFEELFQGREKLGSCLV